MATAKKAALEGAALVKAGGEALALALAHRAEVEPRLPEGLIDEIGSDLASLGAPLAATAPTLSEALAKATNLVTALHEAVRVGDAAGPVRKAWGLRNGEAAHDVKSVIGAAEKAIARAAAEPGEARGFGILPADTEALSSALAGLRAAQAAHAAGTGGLGAKEKKVVEARVRRAIERIGGAGMLAFALDATGVRASFEGLVAR